VEVPLPWERLLWSCRSLLAPGKRYALTDFRLVCIAGERSDELPIHDVGDVHRHQSRLDRFLGTSTLVVHPRTGRRAPFVLAHVRRGAQLAALLELLAGEPRVKWNAESVRSALAWEPKVSRSGFGATLLGLGIMVIAVLAIRFGLHGKAATITYPVDDAVYPGGVKKDREAIVGFMQTEVMPWARDALGPLKGGPDRVTCKTCHGRDAESRDWQMPAVVMLPQPDVIAGGWEVYGGAMDAQMRNAIYGYIAESDNQAKAGYMREIVMPGMARLLRRPAYDFTRSYDYNRSHLAFGCYHCHRVK
jgi:hypothetical protein